MLGDVVEFTMDKVYMTQFFLFNLLERAFRAMKNGVYFIVIAVLVAKLFKIMVYANYCR